MTVMSLQVLTTMVLVYLSAAASNDKRWLHKRALSSYNNNDQELVKSSYFKSDDLVRTKLDNGSSNKNSRIAHVKSKEIIWPILSKDTEIDALDGVTSRKPYFSGATIPKYKLHKYVIGGMTGSNKHSLISTIPEIQLMTEDEMNEASELFSERYRTVKPTATVHPILQRSKSKEISMSSAEYLLSSGKNLNPGEDGQKRKQY